MDQNENQFGAEGGSGVEELRRDLQALQATFATALALLLVFSVCVNLFIWRQVREFSSQEKRARAEIAAWGQGGSAQQLASETWARLTEFSRTHQDFMPIINKYSQFFNGRPATPAPAALKK